MKLRRVKHMFLRLSSEEKVTLIGGLLVLFGSFLPWYEVNLKVESQQVIQNAFSGDLGVIGFVIFLVTLLALLYLTGEHMGFNLPSFGYAKEKVILFLMGQSSFLLLLAVAVYTKRSLDFTDAELRFGLYLSLIGAVLATLSIFAFTQRLKKKEVETFFNKEEDEETEPEEEEEEPEVEQMELVAVEEETPEEEAIEEVIEEVIVEEVVADEPEEKTVEDAIEEEKKDSNPPSMNFYED